MLRTHQGRRPISLARLAVVFAVGGLSAAPANACSTRSIKAWPNPLALLSPSTANGGTPAGSQVTGPPCLPLPAPDAATGLPQVGKLPQKLAELMASKPPFWPGFCWQPPTPNGGTIPPVTTPNGGTPQPQTLPPSPAPVPEPGTLAIFAVAAAGFGLRRRLVRVKPSNPVGCVDG